MNIQFYFDQCLIRLIPNSILLCHILWHKHNAQTVLKLKHAQ